jgi:hypothetical protein
MSRKTYGPEQIVGMLREAFVALGQRPEFLRGLPGFGDHVSDVLSVAQGVWWA